MIFETHAHYDDDKFTEDRDELILAVHESGVHPIINVGASIHSTQTTLELAKHYPFIYAAVGVHPSDVADLNEDTFAWLKEQTAYAKTVAVGEIGLDYYWDKGADVQEKQRYWFGRQLQLAREADLPVIIHSRGSRYAPGDEGQPRRDDSGRDPLLFLLAGAGAGICAHGLLHRSRRRCHLQECKEAGGDGADDPDGADFTGNRQPVYGTGTAPRHAQRFPQHSVCHRKDRRAERNHTAGGRADRGGKCVPSVCKMPAPGIGRSNFVEVT